MPPYDTVCALAEGELVEKRSRFIGAVAPANSPGEAAAFVAARRELHRDARHTVWAYRLRDGQTRCSDDGEPQGTGGAPVLQVLTREGLHDVVLAVTRYFGGVLLGAGGLTRAYAQSAALAVASAKRVTMRPAVRLCVTVDYPRYKMVTRLLPEVDGVLLGTDYGERVALTLLLKEEEAPRFSALLREASAGLLCADELERLYAAEWPE